MEIPKQIQNFNFVLLGGDDGKKPFEKAWQKKVYRIDDPIFVKHIESGKNYGVQSNNSSVVTDGKTYFLVVVDFDNRGVQDKIMGGFPETFITTSGSPKQCYHLWFASDNNKPFKVKDENLNTLADVIGSGNQVVAPGSKHKSGSVYSVVKDIPIAFIPYAELEAILKPYDKSPKKKEKPQKQYSPKGITGDITEKILNSVSMEQLLREIGVDTSKNPTNCFGHSSAGGHCLGWNDKTAHCFHCDNSWNKYSLIRAAKNLTDKETFEWFADKAGMNDELERTRKEYGKQRKQKRNEEEKAQIEQALKLSEEELNKQILELIILKQEDKATEIIANVIKKDNWIDSIKQDKVSEIWFYEDGIRKPNGEAHLKEICRKIFGEAYTPQRANKVIAKIEADTYIEAEEFFKKEQENIDEIACLNGILNIKTKKLIPFTPSKYFFNKINADYIPGAACPNCKKFIADVLKNPEDIKVASELIGYTLYKKYILQTAIMLYGEGENGKGVFESLIRLFLNARNCSSVPLNQLVPGSFDVCELFGKLCNLAGDISNTDLKDSGRFKELTSGTDLVSANRKFGRVLFFINYAKLIFSCNELPRVYDFTPGFWRRWLILEFPYRFLKQKEYNATIDKTNIKLADPEIINKLITPEELSGLLNEALIGLDRLLENKQFSYTKSTAEVKEFWIRKSDSFTAFCFDELEASAEDYISKKNLRRAFNSFCKKHKVKGASDKNIKVVLEDLFGVTEGRKGSYEAQETIWEGIRFKLCVSQEKI